MDDLISRAAAINEFDGAKVDEENCTEYDIGYNDGIDFAVSRLSVLPSAQPETHDKRTETHACDLISRRAAIDATWFEPSYTDPLNVLTEVRDRLKELPSAQPKSYREGYQAGFKDAQSERKRGKWIEDDDGWDEVIWRCSECDAVFTLIDGTPEENEYYFCPHCGADMREVGE